MNIIVVLLGGTLVLKVLKKRSSRTKRNENVFDVFRVSDRQESEAEDIKTNTN